MAQDQAGAAKSVLRSDHARDRARRAARHPERDGGRDRAHGHVALHPREEGLLCGPVRWRRPPDRRLEPARVRRRRRPHRRALSARQHAARRHLLVQRLLRLQGSRVAFARSGVRRPRVCRWRARRLRPVLGALQRYRRHARRARCRPTAPKSSRKGSSCRRCGWRARAWSHEELLRLSFTATRAFPRWSRATRAPPWRRSGWASGGSANCSPASVAPRRPAPSSG